MNRSLLSLVLLTSSILAITPEDHSQYTTPIQYQEALSFLDFMQLSGNEKILNFGCRSGKIALWLAHQIPQGKILALDHDQEMLTFLGKQAKLENLSNIICLKETPLALSLYKNSFDYIVSTSYLHWAGNYESDFRLMYDSLKPGGKAFLRIGVKDEIARKVPFQCHVDAVANRARWQACAQLPTQWYFPTDFETARQLLSDVGFSVTNIWYTQHIATFASTDELTNWILTWVPHAKYLTPELAYSFASQIAERYDAVCNHDENGNIILERPALEIEAQKPN